MLSNKRGVMELIDTLSDEVLQEVTSEGDKVID